MPATHERRLDASGSSGRRADARSDDACRTPRRRGCVHAVRESLPTSTDHDRNREFGRRRRIARRRCTSASSTVLRTGDVFGSIRPRRGTSSSRRSRGLGSVFTTCTSRTSAKPATLGIRAVTQPRSRRVHDRHDFNRAAGRRADHVLERWKQLE